MSAELEEQNGGRVLEVHVSGRLTHKDYSKFVPAFERLVKQHGKLRVLFDMQDFHGWELSALWDDVRFDLSHFRDIDRLAMVGDKMWEKGMSVFCRPFTTARIRCFDRSALQDARDWLNAKAT